jgi:hypothetical protein
MFRKLMISIGLVGLIAGEAGAAETAQQSGSVPPILAQQESTRRTEAPLKAVIEKLQQGQPDLSVMEQGLQQAMRQQLPAATAALHQLGALRTIEYFGTQNGSDLYKVAFQNGATIWAIRMSEGGKIAGLNFQPDRGGN